MISSGVPVSTIFPLYIVPVKSPFKFFKVFSYGPKHAEFAALLPLIRKRVDLTGATIYVYRETADKKLAMARPCPRCMSLIKKYGIKRIKYSTPDGFAVERVFKED